ncbi:hypothetical protein HN014_19670 [Aquimarina sp. TRL1]|uniref:hypothetical protein n=1 Tax=Aquimarina sp. (strain TRL1) TaxID=2736252 RepID=UPI00158DB764|nr:hypothetical protein [Aquimarina sp. TRL1]QKX07036.1 hypothetical protein HN014_19670 [Aquimarina sp. TRL1]
MKKLMYLSVVSVIMALTACNKDEVNESMDFQQDEKTGQVEIIDSKENKNLVIGIAPGLYGPKKVKALKNVTYAYHGHPTALNNIPPNKRRYKIYFQVKNPAKPDVEWDPVDSFEVDSNITSLKFPKFGTNNKAKWRIIYSMYHKNNSFFTYSFKKKVTVINN